MKNYKNLLFFLGCIICYAGCNKGTTVDITPYKVDPVADVYFRKAVALVSNYDVDTTLKCLALLDSAISVDKMNPDYYGIKAKLLCELGSLDSALTVQEAANQLGAINGEYLLQLGFFQAAKEKKGAALESYRRSNDYQNAILAQYPDSLGAFIIQQAAYASIHNADSLYMSDMPSIRKRFPNRLGEVELAKRNKPSHIIKQIKSMEWLINDESLSKEIEKQMTTVE